MKHIHGSLYSLTAMLSRQDISKIGQYRNKSVTSGTLFFTIFGIQ
jgi:hypothetical protein